MKGSGDQRAFEEAMRGVARLETAVERVARRRRESGSAMPGAVEFEVTSSDSSHGLAKGADRRQLARLEAGEWPPERTLDLHGMTAEAARAHVVQGLRQARRAGQRVVRIVHGRGRRSSDGPVLRDALPGWLAMLPHGRHVLAFTTVGPFAASGGATMVLLRKAKRSRR